MGKSDIFIQSSMIGLILLNYNNHELEKLFVFIREESTLEGSIVKGKIEIFLRPINAAIVDIGLSYKGFLPDTHKIKNIKSNLFYLFKVLRDPLDSKGYVLSLISEQEINDDKKLGIIQRAQSYEQYIINYLIVNSSYIRSITVNDNNIIKELNSIDYLKSKITKIPSNSISLKNKISRLKVYDLFIKEYCYNNISVSFYPSPALLAIDIDGSFASPIDINILALKIVARNIILRNLYGTIVIDFLTLTSKKDKNHLISSLRRELMNDRRVKRVSYISRSGLVEINRSRKGKSLFDYKQKNLAALAASIELMASNHLNAEGILNIKAHPEVNKILKAYNVEIYKRLRFIDDGNLEFIDFEIY